MLNPNPFKSVVMVIDDDEINLLLAADKETVVKVAKQGIEGYIKKPFMPDELIARVQTFL